MTPDDPVRPSQLPQLVRQRGFEVLETHTGVRCDYTQDQFSMLQSHFNCLFIVARKHIGAATPAGAPPEPPGAGRARGQRCAAAARPLHASSTPLPGTSQDLRNRIQRPLNMMIDPFFPSAQPHPPFPRACRLRPSAQAQS